MNRWRGSKDANHDDRANDFRALGCTVTDTEQTGIPGWPDLVVGCIGVNHLVEVKNPATRYGRAGMTDEQSVFNRDWRGERVEVVYTTADVIGLVYEWRSRGRAALPLVFGALVALALSACVSVTQCPAGSPSSLYAACNPMPRCVENCTTTTTITQDRTPPAPVKPAPESKP